MNFPFHSHPWVHGIHAAWCCRENLEVPGINLPKLKDSFKQMVEVMLGGVFFSLPISRAGRTRSCPVLPKFVARTGQTVDGISQSKSSTWFSLCILWLPILLQGSIEGSTLP